MKTVLKNIGFISKNPNTLEITSKASIHTFNNPLNNSLNKSLNKPLIQYYKSSTSINSINSIRAFSTKQNDENKLTDNSPSSKKEDDKSQKNPRPIDIAEKMIYEPHSLLTPEEQQRLIKAQVDVYFQKRTWIDTVFKIFMFIMSIVAGFYFFILKATKTFNQEYTEYINKNLDERNELAIDVSEYIFNFLTKLFKKHENNEISSDIDKKEFIYPNKKIGDSQSEWPSFKMAIDALNLDKELIQHPNLKEILNTVFGSESISDLRMLNTNFFQDVDHTLYFVPIVKTSDDRFPKPYIYYFKSEIFVSFPVVNIKTNAVSVIKVVLSTTHDLRRFGKRIARIDPMTPEQIEKKNLQDFQEAYKMNHGTLRYYIDSWNGKFQEESLVHLSQSKVEQNNDELDTDLDPNTNSKINSIEQYNSSASNETVSTQETIFTDNKSSYSFKPYKNLTPEEELTLREKRLFDKKGIISYYWGALRGTNDLNLDFDIFEDDPSEDDKFISKKKRQKKLEKAYYFEDIPLTVDKILLCNPNPIMMDHPGYFNRVMKYIVDGNPVISWPFTDYSEVAIFENKKKTYIGHFPFMGEASTGEAKQGTVIGHIFLNSQAVQGIPPLNERVADSLFSFMNSEEN